MRKEELTKLIQQAIDGDPAAFSEVVATKAEQITYMSIKMMRNRHDGEDAAQETMLKMYQHIGELESPKAFNRWTYQITFRTCIDMMRKQSREDHEFLEQMADLNEMKTEFLPQEYIEDVDKREFLMEVIDSLQGYHKACLLLCYYEGLSYREIAEILNVSEKMVTNTIYRAKQKIRKRMEKEYGSITELLSLSGMAASPVLSQAFRLEMAEIVTPDCVARILAEVGTGTAALTAGAQSVASGAVAQGSGAVGAAGSAGATGTAISTKIVVGVVAAATALGGAGYALFPGNGGEEGIAPTAAVEEAAAILSLEDMIGREAAEQLRGFTSGTQSFQGWEDFLAELPLTVLSGGVVGEATYTLYHMEKQDKQLMILEKTEGAAREAVYRFTDSDEAEPEHMELLESMDRWRQ